MVHIQYTMLLVIYMACLRLAVVQFIARPEEERRMNTPTTSKLIYFTELLHQQFSETMTSALLFQSPGCLHQADRNHMKTKDEFNFSAQSSMSSVGSHVLFVLVRRF